VVGENVRPLEAFDSAVHALNKVRASRMRLYPGVASTFTTLKQHDVPIVAYSESIAYWTEWRIRRTGLDGVIDVLYTSPDHDFPNGVSVDDLRTLPPSEYGLTKTIHKHVDRGLLKPNSEVLTGILKEFNTNPEDTVYVGDSLMKDVAMAQHVGVIDVHAAYGIAQNRAGYDLLRRVSHWTTGDIERERRLQVAGTVTPSYVLRKGFAELLDIFEFTQESK
jgi:phosphoglycolate phosphatase